jgi:hypothetical protein
LYQTKPEGETEKKEYYKHHYVILLLKNPVMKFVTNLDAAATLF